MMYGSGVGERYASDCSEQVKAEYLKQYPLLFPEYRVIVVDEGFSLEEA